ncbi:MAG: type I restriction enzyme HsdR N-terminal domain-containing protein [Chitinophagales bacterium]
MKIVEKEGKTYVFDIIRKKYLVFTPEEKVRQQIIEWMIADLQYPKSNISVEKSISINNRVKRYDIVVYKNALPWMLVECKAESVKIKQETFDQIGAYNIQLKVPYLLVSNGSNNYILEIDFEQRKYSYLKEMPGY